MTWGELKRLIEKMGIKDKDKIYYIRIKHLDNKEDLSVEYNKLGFTVEERSL
jgi:hypothetical protein